MRRHRVWFPTLLQQTKLKSFLCEVQSRSLNGSKRGENGGARPTVEPKSFIAKMVACCLGSLTFAGFPSNGKYFLFSVLTVFLQRRQHEGRCQLPGQMRCGILLPGTILVYAGLSTAAVSTAIAVQSLLEYFVHVY